MSELPLVERLGVSRTPLRLALAALEHEGLLRGLPGGGYVGARVHPGRHARRDRAARRARGHGGALRRRARRDPPRPPRAARDQRRRSSRCVALGRLRVVRGATCDLNERFHARHARRSPRSPLLERALEGILSLPFGGASALRADRGRAAGVSREILVIAHRHHQALIEAIEGRAGRSRRGARPRARAPRADQPRDRAPPPRDARAGPRRVADHAAAGAREPTPR